MLRQRVTSFEGQRAQVAGARNDPQPLQRPRPPLPIGGNGRTQTLRLVAQYADMCSVYSTVAEVASLFTVLAGHCRAVGRDPGSINRSINYWTTIPEAGEAWVEREVRELEAYAAVGTDLVIVKLLDGYDLDAVRRFGALVVGRYRRTVRQQG